MAQIKFKGNPVSTNGELPKVGSKAPCFSLVKSDLSELSCCDLKGKRLVLNIFPSLDTSVCATSVRKFNKLAADMDNTLVIAISKDLPFCSKPVLHDRRDRKRDPGFGIQSLGFFSTIWYRNGRRTVSRTISPGGSSNRRKLQCHIRRTRTGNYSRTEL